jgi:16S rRNA (cytidine1402-2'-O)-methyltransferase
MSKYGTLYLIPTAIGADAASALAPGTRERLFALTAFIAENPKTARQFLKAVGYPHALQAACFHTLDEHTPEAALPGLLAPLLTGTDCGLLSEAGCPGVADPGALLVRLAHHERVRVVPLIGPSAILLALMASGLNGQRFAFHGYLPVQAEARRRKLLELDRESQRSDCTQIFIEAPYRNDAMLNSILAACAADTLVCVASDISDDSEFIRTCAVAEWRRSRPQLQRRPTVFLIYRPQNR